MLRCESLLRNWAYDDPNFDYLAGNLGRQSWLGGSIVRSGVPGSDHRNRLSLQWHESE